METLKLFCFFAVSSLAIVLSVIIIVALYFVVMQIILEILSADKEYDK